MFSLLLLFGVAGLRFVKGEAWTNATCTSDYAWMNNSMNVSPCQVAAQLAAQCNFGNWSIPAVEGNAYVIPENQRATVCTCSWVFYNLIGACTACQGFPNNIANWGYYITGCSGKTTQNDYWPPIIQIPMAVKIPYWATTDPTTWRNQKFNTTEAKAKYRTRHPDLPTATSSSSPLSSPPIGAIVGGVIGGLIVIAFFIACFMWIIRRHRRATHIAAHPDHLLGHSRKISDSTMPILQTPSITSPPFFSAFVGSNSRATMRHTPAPQYRGLPLLEDIIPFIQPPNHAPERKLGLSTDGERPVFDQPNIVRMAVIPSQMPPRITGASRCNPPTYSECCDAGLLHVAR